MNLYWYDMVSVPVNDLPAACEDISGQGFEIVQVVNLNVAMKVPGSLLHGNGQPQMVPLVSVLARIVRKDSLRVKIQPKDRPKERP